MLELEKLFNRIVLRVNINLRELGFDVMPYVANLVPFEQMSKFYAFYGVTPEHEMNFQFRHSGLAGSYFLGKCRVTNSLLYKSDIRGDELKKKGLLYKYKNFEITVDNDEEIEIEESFLIKTLVHNYSHDPENLERFAIRNTIAGHYANIHGSPTSGSCLGPFATVDLTTTQDCVIGTFSYVQAGEISHLNVKLGTIWVRSPGEFNFFYQHPLKELSGYIFFGQEGPPQGRFMTFVEDRKEDFQQVFNVVNFVPAVSVPKSASLDRYAVTKPPVHIGDNVLVCQRAYLQNAWLGKGANAQENCYIINSRLEGANVTAHGAKIINARLEENVFVGFNSFLYGQKDHPLTIGRDSIVMPHTIIDIRKPLSIPAGHLVWGLVRDADELAANSMPLMSFAKIDSHLSKGNMFFEGSGAKFVSAFRNRIQHILEANGAFYNGRENKGHAQKNQDISFNTIQPYPRGKLKGLYPTIMIQP